MLAALAGALAAGRAAHADTTQLSYAGWLNLYGAYVESVKFLKQDFEKKHPGVEWVRNDVPFDQALKQATVATLAGNAADNIHLIAGWVPALYEIGGLEPLDDYFTAEEWAQIPKKSLESVTFDGKIMAFPWVPAPILLFYNRKLMEEAGLDPAKPPTTWPELAEQARKIAALPARNGAPVYGAALRTQRNPNSAQWAIPIIYGMGGDVVDAEGKVTFNTAPTKEAFAWVRDLVKAGAVPAGFSIDETRNTMAAGRAGFIFEGPWGRGLFKNLSGGKATTAPDGDIWVAPMPADPSGQRRTIGNSHEITISKGSKHKKLAAEFIRYVVFDPQFTDMYFKASGQLSTSDMKLLTSGDMGADPYTQIFVQELANSIDNPFKSPKFYAVMDDVVPALQAIIQGGDIDSQLAGADRRIARTMSR
jgi:multiple sugar transport system substrate-binding protein